MAAVDDDPARRRLEQRRRDVQPGQYNGSTTRTEARARISVSVSDRRGVRLRGNAMGVIHNVVARMVVVQ